MVEESRITIASREIIDLKLRALDELIKELIDPLERIGSPEKLVGAPYEEWKDNPQVMQMLIDIYGTEEPNPLSELIFRKSYDEVTELEKEEINGR